MQRKNACIFKYKQDILGSIFVVEGFLAEIVQNHSISWNCVQFIFIFRGAAFLMRWEYLKQDSNHSLKQFLYFLKINFWKKVDVNYKSLNTNKLVF